MVNFLVEFSRDKDYIYGSRMMGGGFGGCTINLIEADKIDEYVAEAAEACDVGQHPYATTRSLHLGVSCLWSCRCLSVCLAFVGFYACFLRLPAAVCAPMDMHVSAPVWTSCSRCHELLSLRLPYISPFAPLQDSSSRGLRCTMDC